MSRPKEIIYTEVLLVKGARKNRVLCLAYLLFLLIIVSSCSKEFINPYDPATRKDEWMPRDFGFDTLGINSVRLFWQQDNRHIDGYVVQKYTNGALKEYLVFRDTIDFIDVNVVEANIDATCPEIRYEVLARAGRNRSDAVGMQSPIYMPLSVPANAGEDVLITDTTTTIQLNAQAATAGEAGRWSIVSGSGGSFANDRQHNTKFTGTPCNAYVLRWTKQGCTETYDEVNISFYPSLTTATAGSDQVFTNSTTQTTLNANAPGLGQTGLWTIVSGDGGTFTDATATNTTFSGQSCTEYVLKWTISGSCGSSEDNVTIKFMKATTAANAGADQFFANDVLSTMLGGNVPSIGEIGTWSVISGSSWMFSDLNAPGAQFTGVPCTNYTLQWTIQGTCSQQSDLVNIGFQQVTETANAGPDQIIISSTTSVILAANNPASGEMGTWSIISGSGGSFSSINAPNATFTGSSCSSYTLRWTLQSPCSNNYNDVNITFQQSVTQANAGPDLNVNNSFVLLTGNNPSPPGIGEWSVVSGIGGQFSNINAYNSSFQGNLGQSYTLRWTIFLCGQTNSDDVVIIFPTSINGSGVTDIDGNNYSSRIIGAQEWMTSNLKTTRYCNGDLIPNITATTTWNSTTDGAWSNYSNLSSNNSTYGKLYNWYSVVDSRNVCPCGWHVPTKSEWITLFEYLGGEQVAGGKLKSTGTQYWATPNTDAINSVGFSALPSGRRNFGFGFTDLSTFSYYWSSTLDATNNSGYFNYLRHESGNVTTTGVGGFFNSGFAIRCLKN